jgi:hypothetical protein
MPDPKPQGTITEGGETTLPDAAAREVQVDASIADMILADVLAMNWRLVIHCLNPDAHRRADDARHRRGLAQGPGQHRAELASGCTARSAAAGGCISTTARAGPSPT